MRLRITDLVMDSDLSSSELREALGVSSNLLAHHLGVLERAGVVDRLRSEGDRRRSYVRLRPEVHRMLSWERVRSAGDSPDSREVVFICTGNSARSPFAAALWNRDRQQGSKGVRASSAGTHPAPQVSEKAVEVAQSFGVDLSAHTPSPVAADQPGVETIVLCDRAYEELPPVSRTGGRRHWAVPNPGRSQSQDAYERVFCEIAERIELIAHRTASTH
ncbi:ArsR family transcriptional regulator [Nesterenkonia sp. Act20]|uniref:arsenate reductase/protein-tyrosine-phosphatase family protein n=1 Tax=Nesterenkonia sp. Act20 TaxID=1483432 RepID=UPI00350E4BD9